MCDRALYGTIGSSMIFVGFFLGGIAVGPFSDKFGRKITMYISGVIVSVFSLLAAFPKAFWLFALFRCLIGFGIGGYVSKVYPLWCFRYLFDMFNYRLAFLSISIQWNHDLTKCQGTRAIGSFYRWLVTARLCSIHFKRPGWKILLVIPRTWYFDVTIN